MYEEGDMFACVFVHMNNSVQNSVEVSVYEINQLQWYSFATTAGWVSKEYSSIKEKI